MRSLYRIKIILVCLVILLGYVVGTPAEAATTKIQRPPLFLKNNSGLVGYWTFDGENMYQNVADTSGSGDNGALFGQSSTTTVPGKLGQALTFDSIDDYVTMGASYNGVQSVAFWIRVATSTTLQKILDLNGTATVTLDSGTVNANSFTSPTRYVDGIAASTVNDTGWHHVVITTATGINASALDVGRISATYFGGSLDDLRIFSRSLTAAEVLNLYRVGQVTYAKTRVNFLTSGLVGYWTFDGKDMYQNVTDVSGNGNTGRIIGQSSTTTAPGKFGQALSFDGVNDYVFVSSFNLNATSVSVSVWAWSNNFSQSAMFVTKEPVNADWELFLEGGVLKLRGGSVTEITTTLPTPGWHHIVGTITGTTGKIYLDGAEKVSGTVTAIANTTDVLNIGRYSASGGGYYFKGTIDDVRIWNRVLSAAEILQLYRAGSVKIK